MLLKDKKLNFTLGLHIDLSPTLFKSDFYNEIIHNYFKIFNLLNKHENIKLVIHISGGLFSYLDKSNSEIITTIRGLIEKKQVELLSGGIYEPSFSLISREDRQTQISHMNRLLNHIYGYTPHGAWISDLSWDPYLSIDLSKSRLQYTCLPKKYFINSGLSESEIDGYFLTEEEARKIFVVPISEDVDSLFNDIEPRSFLANLIGNKNHSSESPLFVLFSSSLIDSQEKLIWIEKLIENLEKNLANIETNLLSDFISHNKPKKRIYLSMLGGSISGLKSYRSYLSESNEINLLHKKMFRVSKKINSAKEGKSRFKVIKDMINQAQELLLKGQNINAYGNSKLTGIYVPKERSYAYSNLIKAENLIETASRQTAKWVQISESDYDCDGHDEIIIESESQNIHVSPYYGGSIIEHDVKAQNLNIAAIVSNSPYPSSLFEYFLEPDISLENGSSFNTGLLTKNLVQHYSVEKIKAKEETCKLTLVSEIVFDTLKEKPVISLQKQLSVRSGDCSMQCDYLISNKSNVKLNLAFAVQFNFSFADQDNVDGFFYLDGDINNKTVNSKLIQSEEIQDINQISFKYDFKKLDLKFSWTKNSKLIRYPIQTKNYSLGLQCEMYQGLSIIPVWTLELEPGSQWDVSIREDIIIQNQEF